MAEQRDAREACGLPPPRAAAVTVERPAPRCRTSTCPPLPRAPRVDEGGQSPRCACHQDAIVRGTLGEPELAHAEREHRRERALEVELPFVDLAEVHQEICLDTSRILDELVRSDEELRAAERLENSL